MPLAANAEGFDYTYAEIGYVMTELDVSGVDIDGDGLGFNGSFEIADQWFLTGSYSAQDFDGVDVNMWSVGGGFHMPMSDRVDFVTTLAWVNAELDAGIVSVDDDGFGLGVGVRTRLTDAFEVDAGIGYVDMTDSTTAFNLSGRYHFTDSFAVGAGVGIDSDATSWNFGFRAQF